jgi:hypothetical protein
MAAAGDAAAQLQRGRPAAPHQSHLPLAALNTSLPLSPHSTMDILWLGHLRGQTGHC